MYLFGVGALDGYKQAGSGLSWNERCGCSLAAIAPIGKYVVIGESQWTPVEPHHDREWGARKASASCSCPVHRL